jgi:hypothetical protein
MFSETTRYHARFLNSNRTSVSIILKEIYKKTKRGFKKLFTSLITKLSAHPLHTFVCSIFFLEGFKP